MRALRPEIANTLYQLIADRVPEPPRHPNGGCRRRVSARVCFEGIFWRFVTGAAWETVEAMLGLSCPTPPCVPAEPNGSTLVCFTS